MSTERSTPRKRSRYGCWTCKKRRRKCDETRPVCLTCQEGGHQCEGYQARLRWDVGVASRGHLTGAAIPNPEAVPPRVKGRQRDLVFSTQHNVSHDTASDTTGISPEAQNHDWSLTPSDTHSRTSSPADYTEFSASSPSMLRALQKETLFKEFLTSGSLNLFATNPDDNPLSKVLPSLCQRSEILYDVCVACQAYLNHGTNSMFYDFYSEALSKYRQQLDHPLRTTDEAIVNASLLLCTIGIMQGTTWTLHLHGIERLLDDRAAMSPLDNVEPAFVEAIEVMGVMDIPRFCVGRQTPSLNAWQRYRNGEFVRLDDRADAVQTMAGLPRSLLDLLACTDEHLTEEQVLLWPGCQGTFLQMQLWEAYRFTLMILVRKSKDERRSNRGAPERISPITLSLPSTDILIDRSLSSIDAVFNGVSKPDAAGSLVLNAMYFPLFFMSTVVMSADGRETQQEQVSKWWDQLCEDPFTNTKIAWEIVQTVAAESREGAETTPDEVARARGIEIGLF